MAIKQATEREQQDIAALEHFALGLRFHGFEEKAERAEQRAEQMRADVWQRLKEQDAAQLREHWSRQNPVYGNSIMRRILELDGLIDVPMF